MSKIYAIVQGEVNVRRNETKLVKARNLQLFSNARVIVKLVSQVIDGTVIVSEDLQVDALRIREQDFGGTETRELTLQDFLAENAQLLTKEASTQVQQEKFDVSQSVECTLVVGTKVAVSASNSRPLSFGTVTGFTETSVLWTDNTTEKQHRTTYKVAKKSIAAI